MDEFLNRPDITINELPDPVPTGQPRVTGYPVTATFSVADSVKVASFTLSDTAGNSLPGYVLNPTVVTENSASFLPVAPLHPATKYSARIVGTNNGVAFDETWSFTTGPA